MDMNEINTSKEALLEEIAKLRQEVETLKTKELAQTCFKSLAENASVILGRLNTQGIVLYLNPIFTLFTKIPIEDTLGRHYTAIGLPAEVCTFVAEQLAKFMQHQKPMQFEGQYTNPDQITYHYQTHLVPEMDERGALSTILFAILDVTLEKEARKELQEQKNLLETLLENTPDVIARIGSDLRFTYINTAFTRATGIPSWYCIGKTMKEAGLPKEVCETWQLQLKKLFTSGKSFIAEGEYHSTTGNTFFYQGQGVPEVNEKGTITSALVIVRNITSLKGLEQTLRMRQQEFAALVENTPNVIARLDKELRCIYINPAIKNFTGLSQKHFLHKYIWEVESLDPNFVLDFIPKLERVMGQKLYEAQEYEYESGSTEEKRYYHMQIVPELDDKNNCESLLVICSDVTPYRQMSKKLAHLDRLNLVGEMAAGIGHEIRNPMTTVRGFLQMLGRKPEYQTHSEFFQLMIDELDRANSIITEFLSLAKDKTLDLKEQDLNQIIQAILPLMQANAIVDNKYVLSLLVPIPKLLLDEKEIRQLILNLVRNGLEAMEPNHNLYIKTYLDRRTQEVVLSIQDEGCGIPPELLTKLGTPFLTTKENGTGLGLAVCYSIANRHNATIVPRSTASGTTFFVRFPLFNPEKF